MSHKDIVKRLRNFVEGKPVKFRRMVPVQENPRFVHEEEGICFFDPDGTLVFKNCDFAEIEQALGAEEGNE